jgi:hypothetical protein
MTTKKKTPKSPTKTQIRQALKALGKTEAEVAKTLKSKRCKGIRKDPSFCPVAIYLQRALGYKRVAVGSMEVCIVDLFRDVSLPEPVSLFVQGFDAGVYPELYKKR